MEVSVIISIYNRSYNLPECIDYLARQEKILDFDWEIVVVDNNSTAVSCWRDI
ncbi:MAG: glycosyltransferase [Deltaproteobacteria bacterium]|nr:glycosyltransferase [Deltaproteobacteria bacterium]